MEQKTSQELDKKVFSDLIFDPSKITSGDSDVLQSLIEKYPYAQVLRSFYSRSLIDSDVVTFEKELSKAALFATDGNILRAIIEDPGSLKSKERENSVIPQAIEPIPEIIEDELPKVRSENPEPDSEEAPQAEVLSREELEEMVTDAPNEFSPDKVDVEDSSKNELTEVELGNILATGPESSEIELSPIDEEVMPVEEKLEERDNDLAGNVIDSLVNETETQPKTASIEVDELDLLIKQNATADFLKEDDSPTNLIDKTEDVFRPEIDIAENISHNAVIEDQQKVSRYDDDKMPYSFLWWLSKTRKEHSDNYQPYVSFQLDTSQSIKRNTVDQLSSQIIENIFHLQSPVDELENAPRTVPFQVKRKEEYILEKFIREEPQIKPPNSDKLNNENKARKSAEDPNDLVSETLAQIYTDQMLFHKAIETYKKLSLKFPEKSTYFADQIRELEKKIN